MAIKIAEHLSKGDLIRPANRETVHVVLDVTPPLWHHIIALHVKDLNTGDEESLLVSRAKKFRLYKIAGPSQREV